MAENKEFYLVIKGEKVIVSEEVYRAYKSSDRAERKRKQRMWRCRIKREKGINNQWKRCQGNCEECQFKQQKMSDVSLDALKEEGFDGVDESLDVEANFIAREERKEMYQKLKQAISSLKPVQREIIKMIYVEGKSQKEVAKELGIAESTLKGYISRKRTEDLYVKNANPMCCYLGIIIQSPFLCIVIRMTSGMTILRKKNSSPISKKSCKSRAISR